MFYLPLSSMCKTPKISSRKRGPPPPCFDRIRTFSSWLFLKSEKKTKTFCMYCVFFFRIDGHWKRSVDIAQQRVPTRCHPSVSTRLREIDSILTLQNRRKTGGVMPVRLDRISWTRLTFPIFFPSPRSSFSLTRHDH